MSKLDKILKEQSISEKQLIAIKDTLQKSFIDESGKSSLKVRIFSAETVYVDTRYGSTLSKKTILEMAHWIIEMLEDNDF